jgi:type II secretory pathway pseudopilin PulG
MIKYFKRILPCHGQSMVEIVVALAIFVLIIASLTSLILGSFSSLERGKQLTQAQTLAQEGIEAVRAIRDRAWNELIYNRSAVAVAGNQWVFVGEGTTEQIGEFTRLIDFLPIYRDEDGNMISSTTSDSYLDVLSKEIIVRISWEIRDGVDNTIEQTTYLTNWRANEWLQTDWSAGAGQTIWSDSAKYDSDDGNINNETAKEISLKEIATSTYASSGYLISSAFNTGGQSAFSAIAWEENLPPLCGSCQIKIQIKTAPDTAGFPGTWSIFWSGPDGEDGDEIDYFATSTGQLIHTDHNGDQWIKYKAWLSGDASSTPVLNEVKVFYQ